MSQNPFHAVSRDLHAGSQELRECFHGLSTFEHQETICATVLILFQSLSLPHTLYFEPMFFKSCYWERVDSRSKWKHGSVAGIFQRGIPTGVHQILVSTSTLCFTRCHKERLTKGEGCHEHPRTPWPHP